VRYPPPLYVAYFTAGNGYAREADELCHSLDNYGLDHVVQLAANLGSWAANTSHKPTFVRDMMMRHDGRPLVYLDADARVRRRPVLFEQLGVGSRGDYDVAVHYFRGEQLASGTIWFAPTARAWALVRRWETYCRANPSVWDQQCLQDVIAQDPPPGLKVYRLPPEYCFIFDLSRQMFPNARPVVEHLQASRRLRT
jgi:hypothetical protein